MHKQTVAAALLAIAASTPALAYERWVHVHNQGQSAIWSVQMSHVDQNSWGRDLLGSYVVPAGSYATVEPDRHQGYCRFDVKIVYESGREVDLWGVNLCEIVSITSNDTGYTRVSY